MIPESTMNLRPALAASPLPPCCWPAAPARWPANRQTSPPARLRENLQNASYNFSGELGFTSLHGSSADDAKPQLSYTINQVARSTKVAFNGAWTRTANGWS
jgi:hypothetical protein